jgi:uncharacterized Rmd1/YagE family protein
MKTTKMFKMDLDNGEGEFIQTPEFYWEDPLLKLDILKDWIDMLTIVYNKTIPKFEKQLERSVKNNK